MLFDTSSPRRKRSVQIVFGLLALLMAIGFVGFNVGGEGQGGGIAEGLIGQENTLTDTAKRDINEANKVLETEPKNTAALARLARGHLAMVNASAYDPQTGRLVEGGEQLVSRAQASWDRYLQAGPEKPDGNLAIQYSQFFANISDYAKAQRAMEIVLLSREPSAGLYSQLTVYALANQDKEKAEQARKRALSLATSDTRRKQIARELDQIEKSINDQIKQQTAELEKQGEDTQAPETKKKIQPTLPTLAG